MDNKEQKDEKLWKTAKKRAAFKRHLLTYIAVNLFLWIVWIISGYNHGHYNFPWPVYVMLGWGIGLAFNYIKVYTGLNNSLQEKEYQKLISKKDTTI